jgi:sec-independent protein translocase protein TatB
MFDIGFSEVLLIFVIALVVLGPEKLPRLASQVGRWIGRARAMARQFREQLEEEVSLEQVRKAHETKPSQPTGAAETTPRIGESSQQAEGQAPLSTSAAGAAQTPDPVDFRADTFSHAHPTNEYGANPLTPNGGAEAPASQVAGSSSAPTPDLTGAESPVHETSQNASSAPSQPPEGPRPGSSTSALPPEGPRSASSASAVQTEAPRVASDEAYAPVTNPTGASAPDAATSGATGPTTRSDNHEHS